MRQAVDMALRWYSIVVDCVNVAAQAEWWRETLGWQTVYEADTEVVIVPAHVNEDSIRSMRWEQVGPGLVFVPVPEEKAVKNRLHIDLAPHTSDDRDAEIAALLERGATLVDVGQRSDITWTVLADPEGNEFCVLSSRDW
ncbi:MAG: VOC family protein [Ilumatobacter sp.]